MLTVGSQINLNHLNEIKRIFAVNKIFSFITMCLFVSMSIIFLYCIVSTYNQEPSRVKAPLITISDGQLRGVVNRTVHKYITYYAYRGIPYAEKPVGNLRFANPVKKAPWTGVLDATKDKSECVQFYSEDLTGGKQVVGSEDCLFINVYTTNVNGNLPVMVYIHGGGLVFGHSKYDLYAPDRFLEYGVIFVSFNYRLGIFGFLSTEDIIAPGNWGLKDQVLALHWVKDNIKSFGGNPNKITIVGESTGSVAASYLVQSNLTRGLYNGAIMESGSSLCLWGLTLYARRRAFSVGKWLGYTTLSSSKLIEYLRTVDHKSLKFAENNVSVEQTMAYSILAGKPFGVVEEPEHPSAVFSGKSWEKLQKGEFQQVPIVIGFTSNEAGYFINSTENAVWAMVHDAFLHVTKLAPHDLTQNETKRLIAGTQIKLHFAGPGSDISDVNLLTRFASNDQHERPVREHARLASKYTDVYYYKFSYEGELGNQNNQFQGVGHAQELNYFYLFNRPINKRDAKFMSKFLTLWTNFVKFGNPTPNELGNNPILDNVVWEPNNSNNNATSSIKYLEIDETLSMKTNPFQEDWTFYQELYQSLGDPPYSTY